MKVEISRIIKSVGVVFLFDVIFVILPAFLILLGVITQPINAPFYMILHALQTIITSPDRIILVLAVWAGSFIARVIIHTKSNDKLLLIINSMLAVFLILLAISLQAGSVINAQSTPAIYVGKPIIDVIPGYVVKHCATVNISITPATINGTVTPSTLIFGSNVVASAPPGCWYSVVSNFASYSEIVNITNYLPYTKWVFIQTMQDGNSTAKLVIVEFSQLPQTLSWLKALGFDPNQAVEAERAFILSIPYNWTNTDNVYYMVYNDSTYATTTFGPYLVVLIVHNAVLPKDVVLQYLMTDVGNTLSY